MRQFNMECPKCGKDFDFTTAEVDDLEDHISELRSDARAEGRWEAMDAAPDGCFHVDPLIHGQRPLWELAAAIQRGDLVEAAHQLDRVAEVLGNAAAEQVQQARFSYRARKVA